MRRTVLATAAATSLALAALAAPAAQATAAPETGKAAASSTFAKEVMDVRVKHGSGKPGSTASITYHRGPVMTASTGTNAYYIWYGAAWTAGGKQILTDFGNNIGGSPYFGINTSYTDASGQPVRNKVTLAGQTTDLGTATSLSDANIATIVSNAITSGRLPKDANGVYFVLTAAGVTESSGFLTQYCGWHTHATVAGSDIKYSFVGDATGPSLSSCAQQTSVSPNGNPGVDAMVSVVAHELEEAVTDPDLNAWYDRQGAENADKCAWTFGKTYTTSTGALANMPLGTRDFLIQRNWRAGTSQGCFLQ